MFVACFNIFSLNKCQVDECRITFTKKKKKKKNKRRIPEAQYLDFNLLKKQKYLFP